MEIGLVKPIKIEEEMKGAYLDYAMSVITARALPDVRDGLKPVQRRILYAMDELSLRHNSPYKKSARIVGEVLGKYHPHGDAPVYETMVRMAQDFSMRYMLIDGQGNFGSVDGDPPAAMRYTEARLAPPADEMLADLDKNTVDFVPNFDGTLKEPTVMPARIPQLLLNGATGIAVGMATNIPPHNLNEIVEALVYIIQQMERCVESGIPFEVVWSRVLRTPLDSQLLSGVLKKIDPAVLAKVRTLAERAGKRPSEEERIRALVSVVDEMISISPEDLMKIVKGPDFPTAGIILGQEGINSAYTTGHGRITIRSRAHIEEVKGGRYQIIITELPYQINKSSLLEKIAEMVHDRRLEGISELRDESDREGMRIVVELKRDAAPKQILNQLYKYTAMQSAFTVNMLALVDGQPRVLNLKAMLLHYLNHRREIVTRRTVFDLEKARQRLHILEGLKIALDHLDEVIATIRRAQDADTARVALIKNFHLSEIQAQAILDMQLRRLAALERKKIVNEYGDTIKLIAHLEDVLAHPVKILYLIRDELLEIKTKYGDARRTRIIAEEAADFSDEDLIPEQEVAIIISPKGYIRRLSSDIYHPQRRAARSSPPRVSWREEEPIQNLCIANTHDNVLFFSNRGRVYGLKAHQIPDSNRQSKGVPIGNLLALGEQETIVGSVALSTSDGDGYCLLITSGGQVKRVALKEYASTRPAGIIATDLPDRDELVKMVLTSGQDEVIIVTQKGQALRFREEEVRPSNRTSGGVRAIKLQAGDKVIGMDVVRPGLALLVITRNRYAKRVALSDFPTHGRGGGGVRVANITAKTGSIVGASVVWTTDELIITLSEGSAVRLPVDSIPLMSRTAQGTALADMGEGKGITSLIHLKGPGAILTEEPAPETDRGPLKKAKTKGSKMASTKAPTDKKEKTAVAATIPTKKTAPTKPAAKQTKKEEIKAATATVPPQKTIQAEPAAKQTKAEKMKVATATVPAKKMAQAKPAAKQAGTMPTAPEKSRKVAPGEAAGRAKSQSRAKTAVAKATPATSTASAQVKPSQGQVQRRSEPRSPQRAAAAEKPPKTSPPDSPKVKQPAKTKGKKRQAKSKQLTLFGAITAALRKTDKK